MKWMLAFAVLVAACDRATAPRAFALGPGCWTNFPLYENGREVAKLKVHYADCVSLNTDSLASVGWQVVWDTTYAK